MLGNETHCPCLYRVDIPYVNIQGENFTQVIFNGNMYYYGHDYGRGCHD